MEAWFASQAALIVDGCWLIFFDFGVAAARETKQATQKESLAEAGSGPST
jgi:hypothetical protein